MQSITLIRVGAILGGVGVIAGAFGAHTLAERVEPDQLDNWGTGADYLVYHALALVLCGVIAARGYRCNLAGWSFLSGAIIFSGTLFAMVLGGAKWLGAITPIGGVLLIIGWGALAFTRRSTEI